MAYSIKIEWTGKRWANDADEHRGYNAAIKALNNGADCYDAHTAYWKAMTEGWAEVPDNFSITIDGETF